MTNFKSFYVFFFFFSYATFTIAQSNAIGMATLTKEIIASNNLSPTPIEAVEKPAAFKAKIWPNPSNLGKVRLSVENLPSAPLYIQIFNHKEELIQEGIIQGVLGKNLEQTLTLPDDSGHYSIKLSNTHKLLKDLSLEIL